MEREIGPVEYMIVSFPGNQFKGEIAPALAKLVESNTIRIIDLAFVGKDADGEVAAFELSDLDEEVRRGLDALGLEGSGFLGEEDLMDAAAELEPNSSAAMLLWEDVWATELADALRGAGGELVALGRLPHDAVMEAREYALSAAANATDTGGLTCSVVEEVSYARQPLRRSSPGRQGRSGTTRTRSTPRRIRRHTSSKSAAATAAQHARATAGRSGGARLHGRAVAARPAQGAGDHHRRGVRGEEEAAARDLGCGLAGRAGTVRRSLPARRLRSRSAADTREPTRQRETSMTDPPPDRRRPPPHARPVVPRGRAIAARILVVLGILLTVVSILSNFVKREALDKDNFRNTSEELIANDDDPRPARVDDGGGALRERRRLGRAQEPAAEEPPAPLGADRRHRARRSPTARRARCSTGRRCSSSSSAASSTAQQQLVDGARGQTRRCSTRPTATSFSTSARSCSSSASASSSSRTSTDRVPQDSAQITLLESDELDDRADLTQWLKAVADWIWVLVLVVLGALPSGSSRAGAAARCGRSAIGLVVTGVLLLVIRSRRRQLHRRQRRRRPSR